MDSGMMTGLSASDVALLNKDNNAFGNEGLWIFALLFLMFGNNGFGFGHNGFGGAATAATQQEILLGQQFEGVHNKLDDIGKGICDSTYALNNSIKDCCCTTQLSIKDVMAGVHAEGEATRAMFRENEIQNLRDKVADLQLKSSQCDQNAYLVNQLRPCPTPAYLAPNPYCSYNPCGCGYQPNI